MQGSLVTELQAAAAKATGAGPTEIQVVDVQWGGSGSGSDGSSGGAEGTDADGTDALSPAAVGGIVGGLAGGLVCVAVACVGLLLWKRKHVKRLAATLTTGMQRRNSSATVLVETTQIAISVEHSLGGARNQRGDGAASSVAVSNQPGHVDRTRAKPLPPPLAPPAAPQSLSPPSEPPPSVSTPPAAKPAFKSVREMLEAASEQAEDMDSEAVEGFLLAGGYNLRGLYSSMMDAESADDFLRELGELGITLRGHQKAIYRVMKSRPKPA